MRRAVPKVKAPQAPPGSVLTSEMRLGLRRELADFVVDGEEHARNKSRGVLWDGRGHEGSYFLSLRVASGFVASRSRPSQSLSPSSRLVPAWP